MKSVFKTNRSIRWTVVRPTYLKNGPSQKYLVKDRLVGEGNFAIHRVDLAKFVVGEAVAREWVHRFPALSYPRGRQQPI